MAQLQRSAVSGNLNITGSLVVTGSSTFNSNLSGTTGQFIAITCSNFSPAITASPAGATNQIQFNSGSALSADPNFVWDNVNDRLGVGTASPSAGLHVDASKGILSAGVTHNYNIRAIGLQGAPCEGTNAGYLILGKKHPNPFASTFVNASYVIGKIYVRRGNNGSGHRVDVYEIISSIGYNGESFYVNCTTPAGQSSFFVRTVSCTYGGTAYHALEFTQSGGGPSTEITFEGVAVDSPLILTDASFVSSVAAFGQFGIMQAAGTVGIGTSNPNSKLTVNRSSQSGSGALELRTSGGIGDGFYDGLFFTQQDGSIPLGSFRCEFKTNGRPDLGFYTRDVGFVESQKVIIKNDGNVGIGTNNPSHKLDVSGTAEINGLHVNESTTSDQFTYFAPQKYIEDATAADNTCWFFRTGDFNVSSALNTTIPFSKVVYNDVLAEMYSDFIPVQAGETLYGEIWGMRMTGVTGNDGLFYCGISRYDKDKNPIAANSGIEYFISPGVHVPSNSTWTKYSGTHTLPTSHTPFNGSDGGPVRYVKIILLVNYNTGTKRTHWGGLILRRQSLMRDSGNVTIGGNVGIGSSNPLSKLYIEGGSADWNETTPGLSLGTIHLDPGSVTNNFGNAITFGSSDNPGSPNEGNNAQAGIYVRSDGNYGTKMYLATTDAYAAGSKTRMMIDHAGNIGIGTTSPNSKLTIGTDFASTSGITVDSANSGDSQLILRRSANKAAFSVLASDSATWLGSGLYYDNGSWIHHNQNGNNQLLILEPGAGVNWYASNNSSPSWNVANGVRLWDDNGTLRAPIRFKNDVWIQSDDSRNRFNFGTNGTTYFGTANNYQWRSPSDTDLMFLDSVGKLGIGTTSPNYKLDVNGEIAIRGGVSANDDRIYFQAEDNSNRFTIKTDLDSTTQNDLLIFRSTVADNMLTLKGDGNVGIGTNSPRNNLEVGNTTSNQQIRIGGVYSGPTSGYTGNGQETSRHELLFSSWRDVVANTVGAKISAINKTALGASPWYLVQNTDIAFSTLGSVPTGPDNTAERMRITSDGNVGIGTTGPNSKLTIGTNFASVNGITLDGADASDSQLVLRKAASKTAYSVLAWDAVVHLGAGVYYDGAAWVHNNNTANSQLFVHAPGTGTLWYASSTNSSTWNVANGVRLWDDEGNWRASIRSNLTSATSGSSFTFNSTSDVFLINATAAITGTLPSAVTVGAGKIINIKRTGAFPLAIDASGTQQIDGSTAVYVLNTSNQSVTLVSDGSNWFIL